VDSLTGHSGDLSLVRVSPREPDIEDLIHRHFALMRSQTPPESCHVLPATALEASDVQLFALRVDGRAVAIGAMRVTGDSAELKSMHTAEEVRGRGFGRRLLAGMLEEAQRLGLRQVQLETGSGNEHAASRSLYARAGFHECPPFGDYAPDPLSTFMARKL
jgi:putative acetyltransferase